MAIRSQVKSSKDEISRLVDELAENIVSVSFISVEYNEWFTDN